MILLAQSKHVSELLAKLPQRFTSSDRIKDFAREKSLQIIAALQQNAQSLLLELGYDESYELDLTDGLRITLASGDVVHLRPSGNAPELRCYAEAESSEKAIQLVNKALVLVQAL